MNTETTNANRAATQAENASGRAVITSCRYDAPGFAAAMQEIYQALNSGNLNKRHRLVLEFILGRSLRHPLGPRGKAYIPDLQLICDQTGISYGNTFQLVNELKSWGVVWEKPRYFFGIVVSTLFWTGKARRRVWDAAFMEQPDLIAPPPEFNDELLEVFIAANAQHIPPVPESGTKPNQARFPNREPETVPESGTKTENAGNPLPVRVSHAVPESGTGAGPARARNVKRLNVNEEKIPNVKRSKAVPDSGTKTEKPLVTMHEERRLMNLITEFFTDAWPEDRDRRISFGHSGNCPQEMAQSGVFWRLWCVRNFPDAVEEALGEARLHWEAKGKAMFTEGKAKWLNWHVREYAGVNQWSEVRPGPKPVA